MKTIATPVKGSKSGVDAIVYYSKAIAQFKDKFAKFVIFVREGYASEFELELRMLGLRTFDHYRENRPTSQQDIVLGQFSLSKTGVLITTLNMGMSNWNVLADASIFVNRNIHLETTSGIYSRLIKRVKTDKVIFLDCTFGDTSKDWKKERRIEDVSPSTYGLPKRVAVSRLSVDRRADDAFTEMVRVQMPNIAAVCDGPAEEAVFHQKDFGSGYHKDDITLIGTAVKYAGLCGKTVRFIPDGTK
jgi:hypothetical protein